LRVSPAGGVVAPVRAGRRKERMRVSALQTTFFMAFVERAGLGKK
jgi:hypothetical protein